MGKSSTENFGDVIGSALGKAWREAVESADGSSPGRSNGAAPKRSGGPLSGARGVILGAGLGVLAATKGVPLVKDAMLKYVTSHAAGAAGQGNSPSGNGTGSG